MTRRFLRGYAATIVPLLVGLVAAVLGWVALAGGDVVGRHPWASAVVGGIAWMLAVAVWLRCRGWRSLPIHAVTWVAPVLVLAAPAAAGWLSADGLVLWAPAITVVTVSLGMATDVAPGTFGGASSWAPPQHPPGGGTPWVSQRGVTRSATSSGACPRPRSTEFCPRR